jgi:hypothetical protein
LYGSIPLIDRSEALFFCALFVFCLLILPSSSAQDGLPENTIIHGTVVNSVTHEPIARALVTSADNRFGAMTDSEGHFEFSATASYTERNVAAAGIATKIFVSIAAKKPGFLQDRAIMAESGKETTVPLIPEALIVGHVTLPSSEPSDRIQVDLYHRQIESGRAHWRMQSQVTTRSTGEFRFAELHAGSYKLLTRELLDRDPSISDPRGNQFGYPPVYFPGAGDFVAAETIQLSAGQVFQADMTLVKQPYYPVKIALANPQLGFGVEVIVAPQGHWGPGYALGAGQNTIEGLLPNGTYTVETVGGSGTSSAVGSMILTVKGARADGSSMAMAATGSIPVNVKEEFSNPEVQGGTVGLSIGLSSNGLKSRYLNIQLEPADDFGLERNAFARQPTETEDQEHLTLDNVRPGRYWVGIHSIRGYASSVTSGDVDLQHQPLVVNGGTSSPIEVTMRDDWAHVEGTIDALGASVGENDLSSLQAPSEAHIYFIPLPESDGDCVESWAGRDGHFDLQIPPGAYRVLAFDRPRPDLEYRNPEAMRAYESKGQVVRLTAHQNEQMRLQLISTNE